MAWSGPRGEPGLIVWSKIMKSARPLAFSLLCIAVAACARGDRVETARPSAVGAQLLDAGGRRVASAQVFEEAEGLRVRIDATALNAGAYGVHLHAVGACDAPDFASAGPHWNPTNRQHGSRNPAGPHAGDLPNLLVGTDGRGTLEYLVRGPRLTGSSRALLDADGAALVIHVSADDLRTDPSGNSGARLACGALAPIAP